MTRLGLGYDALLAGQSAPCLLRDLRLRPGRSAARRAGLRPDRPGHVGRDEHHRRARTPRRIASAIRSPTRSAALTAAFAIAAALAERDRTGGRFIDVSMLEATLATMGWAVSNCLIAGHEPRPMGNDNVTASPSGTFRTARRTDQHRGQQAGAVRGRVRVVGRPGCRRPAFRRPPGAAAASLGRRSSSRPSPPIHRGLVAAADRRRRAGRPGATACRRRSRSRRSRAAACSRASPTCRVWGATCASCAPASSSTASARSRHAAAAARRAHRRAARRAWIHERRDRIPAQGRYDVTSGLRLCASFH